MDLVDINISVNVRCKSTHRMPGIVSVPLLFYDPLIDLASGDIVFSSKGDIQVALIVSKVEINFTTVVKYKAFSVSIALLVLYISRDQFPGR